MKLIIYSLAGGEDEAEEHPTKKTTKIRSKMNQFLLIVVSSSRSTSKKREYLYIKMQTLALIWKRRVTHNQFILTLCKLITRPKSCLCFLLFLEERVQLKGKKSGLLRGLQWQIKAMKALCSMQEGKVNIYMCVNNGAVSQMKKTSGSILIVKKIA